MPPRFLLPRDLRVEPKPAVDPAAITWRRSPSVIDSPAGQTIVRNSDQGYRVVQFLPSGHQSHPWVEAWYVSQLLTGKLVTARDAQAACERHNRKRLGLGRKRSGCAGVPNAPVNESTHSCRLCSIEQE